MAHKRIKRLKKINILGVDHKIRYPDLEDHDGYYYAENKLIEIDRKIKGQDRLLYVTLHEALHGVLNLSGVSQNINDEQEHCIIDSVITFLMANLENLDKIRPE